MNLIEKYGKCIVPKDTIVFTTSENGAVKDVQFFSLKYFLAKTFKRKHISNARNVYAFRVIENFEVLFMLKELNKRTWYISAGADIYNEHFHSDHVSCDLDIKLNKIRFNAFIDILKKQNISACLNSLEDKDELELLVFAGENFIKNHLSLIMEIKNEVNEFNNYDALKFLEIEPSLTFMQKSKMNAMIPFPEYEKKHRQADKEYMRDYNWTKEETEFQTYNLRMKLKI